MSDRPRWLPRLLRGGDKRPEAEQKPPVVRSYMWIDPETRNYLKRNNIKVTETPRRPGGWEEFRVSYPAGTRRFRADERVPGDVVKLPEGYEPAHIFEEQHGRDSMARYISQPQKYFSDDREEK